MGAELLLVTGGMSVDPDDVTRQGVAQAGAKDFIYGAPVLPGAMFMVSAIGDVPVLGIPACGLYHEATIFDLVLPANPGRGATERGKRLPPWGMEDSASIVRNAAFRSCPFGKGACEPIAGTFGSAIAVAGEVLDLRSASLRRASELATVSCSKGVMAENILCSFSAI